MRFSDAVSLTTRWFAVKVMRFSSRLVLTPDAMIISFAKLQSRIVAVSVHINYTKKVAPVFKFISPIFLSNIVWPTK